MTYDPTRTQLPAPERTACPPRELHTRALAMVGVPAELRRLTLGLMDSELEARRPAHEVTASLVLR